MMTTLEVDFGPQFVDVLCHDCVIRVDSADPECPVVEVRLVMGHPSQAGGWRYRLREAVRAWRGEGQNWYDFYSQGEVDRFIRALERAKWTLPTIE